MSRKKGLVETDEYAGMIERMIRAWGRRVGDGDYTDLAAMQVVQHELDDVMMLAVTRMRETYGYSWTDVGKGLGITRQAAEQRFGKRAQEKRTEKTTTEKEQES